MELNQQKKLNAHIFRLLKVNEIVIPIGRTNKGNLGLKFQANSDDFEIMLDAVPLSTKSMLEDENNIELKRMLEKYLFDKEMPYRPDTNPVMPIDRTEWDTLKQPKAPKETKRRGRPAGAKNKVKA